MPIKFENISKQYHPGKEDPNLKIGQVNDRAAKATDDYVWGAF